jgi:hypothetical protein
MNNGARWREGGAGLQLAGWQRGIIHSNSQRLSLFRASKDDPNAGEARLPKK